MYKTRPKLIGHNIYPEIYEAYCDICSNNCMFNGVFEGLKLKANWGYDSKKDGEYWRACICEECTDTYLSNLINFNKNE